MSKICNKFHVSPIFDDSTMGGCRTSPLFLIEETSLVSSYFSGMFLNDFFLKKRKVNFAAVNRLLPRSQILMVKQ